MPIFQQPIPFSEKLDSMAREILLGAIQLSSSSIQMELRDLALKLQGAAFVIKHLEEKGGK
jgi:hypothetical protein